MYSFSVFNCTVQICETMSLWKFRDNFPRVYFYSDAFLGVQAKFRGVKDPLQRVNGNADFYSLFALGIWLFDKINLCLGK